MFPFASLLDVFFLALVLTQATKILGVFSVFRRTVLALHPSGADNLDQPCGAVSGRLRSGSRYSQAWEVEGKEG